MILYAWVGILINVINNNMSSLSHYTHASISHKFQVIYRPHSFTTYSDSVCRLEATNTGFCRSLSSVSCHVILAIRVVYARFQATD